MQVSVSDLILNPHLSVQPGEAKAVSRGLEQIASFIGVSARGQTLARAVRTFVLSFSRSFDLYFFNRWLSFAQARSIDFA